MRVRVRHLVRREALERDVEAVALRDRDTAEARRAGGQKIVRRGAEDAEVPQDLVEIADGPLGHGPNLTPGAPTSRR